MGAVLAPGKRTVSAVLRILGLKAEKNFHKYHRMLSLVEWRALEAARILLKLLLTCFLPVGPVIVGIDETLERRWERKIAQRGIYRDSVRSSGSHFVKSSAFPIYYTRPGIEKPSPLGEDFSLTAGLAKTA